MTVGELLPQLSSQEYTDWVAFYAIEAAERKEAQRPSRRPK